MAPKDLNKNQEDELIQLAQAIVDDEVQTEETTPEGTDEGAGETQPIDLNSPEFKQRIASLLEGFGGEMTAEAAAAIEQAVLEVMQSQNIAPQDATNVAATFVQTVQEAVNNNIPLTEAIQDAVNTSTIEVTVVETDSENNGRGSSNQNEQKTSTIVSGRGEENSNPPNIEAETQTVPTTPNTNTNTGSSGNLLNNNFNASLSGSISLENSLNNLEHIGTLKVKDPVKTINDSFENIGIVIADSDREVRTEIVQNAEDTLTSNTNTQQNSTLREIQTYKIYDGSFFAEITPGNEGEILFIPENILGDKLKVREFLSEYGLYSPQYGTQSRDVWKEKYDNISAKWLAKETFSHKADFDPSLANNASILSSIAYEDISLIRPWLNEHSELSLLGYYTDSDDNQFFYTKNQDSTQYTITFRGTDGIADHLNTNLDIWGISDGFDEKAIAYDQAKWQNSDNISITGNVHNGFGGLALTAINHLPEEMINDLLSGQADITVTGHSLGGAASEIFAAILTQLNVSAEQIQVYTIGAPATGNQDFIDTYSDIPVFGLNEVADIVPRITNFLGFKHLGDRLLFSTWGDNHYLEADDNLDITDLIPDNLSFRQVHDFSNGTLTYENVGENIYQEKTDNDLIFLGKSDKLSQVEVSKLIDYQDYLQKYLNQNNQYISIGYESFNFPDTITTHDKYKSYVPFASSFYQMLTSTPVEVDLTYRSKAVMNEDETFSFEFLLNHSFYKDISVTYEISEFVNGELIRHTGPLTDTVYAFEEGLSITRDVDDQVFTGTRNVEIKVTNVTNATIGTEAINYIVKEAGDVPPIYFNLGNESLHVRFINGEPQFDIKHDEDTGYQSAIALMASHKNAALNMISSAQTLNAILDFDASETITFYKEWTDAIDGINNMQAIIDGINFTIGTISNIYQGNVAGIISNGLEQVIKSSLDFGPDFVAKAVGAQSIQFGYKILDEYSAKKNALIQDYYNGLAFEFNEQEMNGYLNSISEVYYLQKLAQESLSFGMEIYKSTTDTSTDNSVESWIKFLGDMLVSAGPSNNTYMDDLAGGLGYVKSITEIIDKLIATGTYDFDAAEQVWKDITSLENLHTFYSETTQKATYQKLLDNGYIFNAELPSAFDYSVAITSLSNGDYISARTEMGRGGYEIVWERYGENHQLVYDGLYVDAGTNLSAETFSNDNFLIVREGQKSDQSEHGIYGYLYDKEGNVTNLELPISQSDSGTVYEPATTLLTDDTVVVVYTYTIDDGSVSSIMGTRVDNNGNIIDTEFIIHESFNDYGEDFSVAALSNDGFLVSWVTGNKLYAQKVSNSGVPLNDEFLISDQELFTSGPELASLNDGAVVATWTSEDSGYIRIISDDNTLGTVRFVDTPMHDIAVEPLSNGGFYLVWADHSTTDIYGQAFNSNGTPSEASSVIGSKETLHDHPLQIETLSNGDIIVTWSSADLSKLQTVTIEPTVNPNELPINTGNDTIINESIDGTQTRPDIAALDGGGFVAVWSSSDGSGYGIFGQLFDEYGAKTGNEFQINNTYSNGAQDYPAVTGLKGGGFAVSWQSYEKASSGIYSIAGRTYDLDGNPVGDEYLTSTITSFSSLYMDPTPSDQTESDIIQMSDGGYMVVWSSESTYQTTSWASSAKSTLNTEIRGQRYDDNGEKIGNEISVGKIWSRYSSTNEGYYGSHNPSIDVSDDGSYVVSWTNKVPIPHPVYLNDKSWGHHIYAQKFNPDGSKAGGAFKVSDTPVNSSTLSHIKYLDDGDFIIRWDDDAQLYSANAVRNGNNFTITEKYEDYAEYVNSIELKNGNIVLPFAKDGDVYFKYILNEAPTTEENLSFIAQENNVLVISKEDLLEHVSDINGDQVYIADTGYALTDNGNGTYTFTPPSYFVGNSEFTFTVTDRDPALNDPQAKEITLTASVQVQDVLEQKLDVFGTYATKPQISILQDGSHIIVWEATLNNGLSGGIYARKLNSSGTIDGDIIEVKTSEPDNPSSFPGEPSLTTLSDGNFLVTYSLRKEADGDLQVYGQKFDENGTKTGNEFLVNSNTDSDRTDSSISSYTNGFIVSWTANEQDGDQNGIYAQRFDNDGNKVGDEVLINTTTLDGQFNSSVSAFSDGGFVVTWISYKQDGDNAGIISRLYDNTGSPVTSEVIVNTHKTGGQYSPSVASFSDGGYVVTWHTSGVDQSQQSISGQLFNNQGQKVGTEFTLNTYEQNGQSSPSVSVFPDNKFVVTWQSWGQDEESYGVFGQVFDQTGGKIGREFQVNTYQKNSQDSPNVEVLDNGDIAITWVSNQQEGDGSGIYTRIVPASEYSCLNDPLVFDFNADQLFIGNKTSHFDIDNDGEIEVTNWTSLGDGMLVMDKNKNNKIDNMLELFSEHMFDSVNSSLDALATFDSNSDDIIDNNDNIWTDLKIWQDANTDGITNEGELFTMADLEISSINLKATPSVEDVDGGMILSRGSFIYENGSEGEFAEVAFEVVEDDIQTIQDVA